MSTTLDVKLDPSEEGSLFEAITGECCCIPDEGEQARAKVGESVPGCQELAEFEIEDPTIRDPYSRSTHACAAHVGELIGAPAREIDARDGTLDTRVRPVEVECKACAIPVPWTDEALRAHAEEERVLSDGSKGSCGAWWRVAQEGKDA